MKYTPLLFLLFSCQDIVKYDETQSNYECFLTVEGTELSTGMSEVLVESSYELICSTENDKNTQMDENCSVSESNYTSEYSGLRCDWECIETTSCD